MSSPESRWTRVPSSLLEPTVRPPPRALMTLASAAPSTMRLVPASPSGVQSLRSAPPSHHSSPSTRTLRVWLAMPSSARRMGWCPLLSLRSLLMDLMTLTAVLT
ncbi:hypothetical protein VPH35_046508 [Triticum aestivum]